MVIRLIQSVDALAERVIRKIGESPRMGVALWICHNGSAHIAPGKDSVPSGPITIAVFVLGTWGISHGLPALAASNVQTGNPLRVQVTVPESASPSPGLGQSLSFQHPQPGADSSQLLQDITGAQSLGSGTLANQPFLSGLGGNNLNVLVDGISIPNACPNEMMPALSYLPPSQVGKITVYPTVAPVTQLTGALGGAISVHSPTPIFASAGQSYTAGGSLGAFYRSNGDVHGENLSLYGASRHFSIRYDGSLAQGDNVHAAAPFKAATTSIPAKTIASTAMPPARPCNWSWAWPARPRRPISTNSIPGPATPRP